MKTILIALFCFISVDGVSQFKISFDTGYGSFQMSSLKSLQESQLRSFPVEAEITSSFPPYWTYGLSGSALMRNSLILGASASLGSTGSRTYYEDYSGSIGVDYLLRFTSLSVAFGGWGEISRDKVYYYVDLSPGITITSLTLKSFSSQGQYNRFESATKVKSLNVTIQPTVAFTYRFGRIGLTLSAGHHLTLVSGKLKPKENKDAYLADDGGPVKADWSGLRVGLGVSMFFSSTKS